MDGGFLLTVFVCRVGLGACWGVTIGKLRARPQSIDLSYRMSEIGCVEGPDTLLWDGCDLSCLQLGDIPMV